MCSDSVTNLVGARTRRSRRASMSRWSSGSGMVEYCPLCESRNTEVFLRRAGVPVHQNQLASTEQAARAVPRGDIFMTVCKSCGFVFNAEFDPQRLDYGSHYENTQA